MTEVLLCTSALISHHFLITYLYTWSLMEGPMPHPLQVTDGEKSPTQSRRGYRNSEQEWPLRCLSDTIPHQQLFPDSQGADPSLCHTLLTCNTILIASFTSKHSCLYNKVFSPQGICVFVCVPESHFKHTQPSLNR